MTAPLKAFGALAVVALIIGLAVGWVLNIVYIVVWYDYISLGELLVRLVGIFFVPLGGVMGYF